MSRTRRASERDLEPTVALWMAIAEHHSSIDPCFALGPGAAREVRALFRAELGNPDVAVFLYEEDGECLGLCIARIDHAPPILQEVRRGEITDLGVRADRRRRGIGRQLVRRALEWLEGGGVRRVEVRVATRNAEGQAFWRTLGFGDLMDVLQVRL